MRYAGDGIGTRSPFLELGGDYWVVALILGATGSAFDVMTIIEPALAASIIPALKEFVTTT